MLPAFDQKERNLNEEMSNVDEVAVSAVRALTVIAVASQRSRAFTTFAGSRARTLILSAFSTLYRYIFPEIFDIEDDEAFTCP